MSNVFMEVVIAAFEGAAIAATVLFYLWLIGLWDDKKK